MSGQSKIYNASVFLEEMDQFMNYYQICHRGKKLFYYNQQKLADEMIDTIITSDPRKRMLIARGLCQAGKTGLINAFIRQMFYRMEEMPTHINPDNIFIITGVSFKSWKEQTTKRFTETLRPNICKRDDLKNPSIKEKLQNLKDGIIICDESHYGSGGKMTIAKVYKELGITSIQTLHEQNIYMLEVTATPSEILSDLSKWANKESIAVFTMEAGLGYTGVKELREREQIRQAESLYVDKDFDPEKDKVSDKEKLDIAVATSFERITKLKNVIETTYESPRYHIIRTEVSEKQDILIERIRKVFDSNFNIELRDSRNKKHVMEDFKKRPEKHTILITKEQGRLAETWEPKCNIGVVVDRMPKKPNMITMIQSKLGRLCGYDSDEGNIIYTDLEIVDKYIKDWDNFRLEDVIKKSSKITRFHPNGWNEDNSTQARQSQLASYDFKVYQSFNDAKRAVKIIRDKNARAPKIANGFYISTYMNTRNGERARVHSYNEVVHAISRDNVGSRRGEFYNLVACYTDINDVTTVRFVVPYKAGTLTDHMNEQLSTIQGEL